MSELTSRNCKPCEGGVRPFSANEASEMVEQLHEDWQLNDPSNEIRREFKFKNFHATMAFVNAVAWIAHHQDHHPDLEVGYNRCLVRFSTHAIGGLSENDFICAARVDALF